MISTEHLIQAVAEQFRILKHLGAKVTTANKAYRLSDAQRTTEEVEQYIVSSLPVQVKLMAMGNWDNDIYTNYTKKFDAFTFAQFSDLLDQALVEISADLKSVSPEQRDEEITMRGSTVSRSTWLVDYLLVFLGAYKMQLFLQLKASGCIIDTNNLWAGMDTPTKD